MNRFSHSESTLMASVALAEIEVAAEREVDLDIRQPDVTAWGSSL